MSFIRPEAQALVTRWREVIALAVLACLGLWIALSPGLILPFAGWGMVAIACLLAPASLRRARFQPGAEGAGVVTLSEGRVSYLGPLTGGTLSLDELDSLSLITDPSGKHWHLTQGPEQLVFPIDALGGDQLFDAFARLPGLSSARLLAAIERTDPGEITLWRRTPHRALTPT